MRLRLGKRSPIGLDVSERTIAAVQLSGGEGAWRVEAAAALSRGAMKSGSNGSPTSEELAYVEEALYRHGFTGNRVVIVAPESAMFSTTLELPPRSSGAPIDELARQELARSAKRDASTIEVSSWDVPSPPRSGESTHLLAVGLAHQDADQLLDVFEAAGFEVDAVDCRCCAMARACTPVLGVSPHVSSILDLSDSAASIAVVHSGIVVYDRPVREAGLGRLWEQVRSELRVDDEAAEFLLDAVDRGASDENVPEQTVRAVTRLIEAHLAVVVQELRSVMAYAIHRYSGTIGPVMLTGSGARMRGLHQRIRTELDLEAKTVSLCDIVGAGGGSGDGGVPAELADVCRDPSLTAAAGMAMHASASAVRRAA